MVWKLGFYFHAISLSPTVFLSRSIDHRQKELARLLKQMRQQSLTQPQQLFKIKRKIKQYRSQRILRM